MFVEDKLAPSWLGFVNPKTATPIRALSLTLFACVLLLVMKQLSLALSIAVFALILLYFIHSLVFLLLPRLNPKIDSAITLGMPRVVQRLAAMVSVVTMGILIVVQIVQDFQAIRTNSLKDRFDQKTLTSLELAVVWAIIGTLLYAIARWRAGRAVPSVETLDEVISEAEARS
jgi:amino acid transporter